VQGSVALLDLADELSVRKQWLFKIVKRLGIPLSTRREATRGGQKIATVVPADAERIRREVAAARHKDSGHAAPANDEVGYFYVVQLEPKHDPGRFKVGFTLDLDYRLAKHRTAAPFAEYRQTWPCHRTWERAATDCVAHGTDPVRSEVYRASSLDEVLRRADSFFAIMPRLERSSTVPASKPGAA